MVTEKKSGAAVTDSEPKTKAEKLAELAKRYPPDPVYDNAEWACPECLQPLFAPWVKHTCGEPDQ